MHSIIIIVIVFFILFYCACGAQMCVFDKNFNFHKNKHGNAIISESLSLFINGVWKYTEYWARLINELTIISHLMIYLRGFFLCFHHFTDSTLQFEWRSFLYVPIWWAWILFCAVKTIKLAVQRISQLKYVLYFFFLFFLYFCK